MIFFQNGLWITKYRKNKLPRVQMATNFDLRRRDYKCFDLCYNEDIHFIKRSTGKSSHRGINSVIIFV